MNIVRKIAASTAVCGGLAALLASSALQAQTVRTHVSNGASSQLYDFVFLGDGYRSTEEARFLQDVDDCIAYMRDQARIAIPYGDYFASFNFHSVFRASTQSGIDQPDNGLFRNTAYGASYGTGANERCITLNAAGRTLALNDRALAPGTETLLAVLTNDTIYGGCASGGIACQYNGASMEDVLVHEWGHVYAGLADEYAGDPACFTGAEPSAVNVTANSSGSKWSHWIGATGPNSTVGTFQGAQYFNLCKWRPESDCEMRNLNQEFCAVCRERFIRLHHQRTTMVYSPAADTTAVSSNQHTTRRFTLLHRIPANTVEIDWRIDGGPWLPGGTTFDWSIGNASVGLHTVQARIVDGTNWVRVGLSDLDYIKTWNVTVSANVAAETDFREILPDSITNMAGNSSSGFPWNTAGDMRVMYAYGRDTITPEHPVTIRGVQFRPQEALGAWGGATYQFSLDMSTSRLDADALSSTFANNHGSDLLRVYDGALTVPGASLGATPNPFVITIPFATPFEWNPCSGPLLFDFRFRGLQSGTGITCDGVFNDPASNVYRIAHQTNADATVADFALQNFGLVANLILDCQAMPSALAGTEGNSSSAYPWNTAAPMRVQYVYDEGVVGLDEMHYLTRLAWRTDNGTGFSGGNIYNMTVSLSTGAPGLSTSLSTNFNANHGADRKVVFQGAWRPSSTGVNAAPSPFDQVLELQRPFFYSPRQGSLVVDIQLQGVSTGGLQASFDGLNAAASGTGRVYNLSSATAATGTTQSFGLAMCASGVPTPVGPYFDDGIAGGSSTAYPWGTSSANRAMMFYDTSGFSAGAQNITHLSWRPNEGTGAFGPVVYNARIDLSTADFFVNDLASVSSTFDTNHGDDRVTVFNGDISVPYRRSSGSPSDFWITVKLDRPFRWKGTGALVVDIRKSNGFVAGSTVQSIDGSFGAADVARLVNTTDRNATTGDLGPQDFAITLRLGGEGANGQVIPYGAGCNGQNGVPIGSTRGLPWTGNLDYGYAIFNGPSTSNVAALFGTTATSLPLGVIGVPCNLLVDGIFASIPATTNSSGDAVISAPVPADPNIDGFSLRYQWAALDLTAPGSITLSNGSRIIVRH